MARHAEAATRFTRSVSLRHDRLLMYLNERIQDLEKRITVARCAELSDEVASELGRIGAQLEPLRGPHELQKLMEALRLVTSNGPSSFRDNVARLENQANKEWADYKAALDRFQDRARLLRSAAEAINEPTAGYDTLTVIESAGIGLSRLRQRLQTLCAELDNRSQLFISSCLKEATSHLAFCESARSALEVTTQALPNLPAAPSGVDAPDAAAHFCLVTRTLRRDFEMRVQKGIPEVQKAIEEARQRGELLAMPGFWAAEDSDGAQGWMADFSVHRDLTYSSDFDRLKAGVALLLSWKRFYSRFEKDEQEVGRLMLEARDRLQNFSTQELRRFFPEHSQRVSALVYGVNIHTQQWARAKDQLKEALRLLELLEVQSRRLAAQEAAVGQEGLETKIRRTALPPTHRQRPLGVPADPNERRTHA